MPLRESRVRSFHPWHNQASTVGVTISGTGCLHSSAGWEARLERFLHTADGAQISRIDLAHDDFCGERFCIENVLHGFHQGFFQNGGRYPKIELRGNHIRPDGRGRSVYIGTRENMLFRGYEKGRHLGDPASRWLRLEVEIHNGLRLHEGAPDYQGGALKNRGVVRNTPRFSFTWELHNVC